MTDAPYRRVHVVINPASGKDEPILNTLNDVFRQHDVSWDVSVTHKYGDAKARLAPPSTTAWISSPGTAATARSTRSPTRS